MYLVHQDNCGKTCRSPLLLSDLSVFEISAFQIQSKQCKSSTSNLLWLLVSFVSPCAPHGYVFCCKMVRSQRNKIVNPITSPRRIENRSIKYTPAETRVYEIFGTGFLQVFCCLEIFLFFCYPEHPGGYKTKSCGLAIGVVKDSKTQFAWQRFVI